MAWFLKLYKEDATDIVFSMVDSVDVEELQQQLVNAQPGEVVHIPARMSDQMRESPLFVRPDRWSAWQFFHHDAETIE